ncbi:MAG: hypothetical protein ABI811_04095 [Acidobacteriota bacterium]
MDFAGFAAALWQDMVARMSGFLSVAATAIGFYQTERGKRRLFWAIGVIAFFVACVSVWTDEHSRNQSQLTYMELDTSQAHSPRGLLMVAGERAAFSLGLKNIGSFRADDSYHVTALELHAPASRVGSFGQMWLTSQSVEREVWGQFLKSNPGPHPRGMALPGGPDQFTTALSSHAWSEREIASVNTAEAVIFLVGYVVWKDPAGTHERRLCQFFHYPPREPFVLENCYGYNDFMDKAID